MFVQPTSWLRLAATAFIGTAVWGGSALAATSVNVGSLSLNPNQAGQVRSVSVAGGDLVDGLALFLEVNNGVAGGPKITNVEMITGTIFSNAAGFVPTTIDNSSFYQQAYSVDGPNSVSASGTFASITFDTTGINSGSWAFDLTDVVAAANDTDFFLSGSAKSTSVTNGTLNIIPEPDSLAIGGIVCALALFRRKRA